MSYAPFRTSTQTYKGSTFGFSFTIKEDGSALDLTTLTKVEASLFSPSTTVFTYDTNGNLTISGSSNNVVSGTAPEATMDIAKRTYYLELRLFFSDGTKEVYSVVDVKIIDAESAESQGAQDWTLDIDNDSETVTGQATSNLAEAIQAKTDAETAETNAQASETESQENADDAEKQAQNTTSFTDSDGNTFTKGAKGYANDASASATNASNSESESQDNADDAEKYAINTTSFTDSDGNTRDKGAKGYANDAQTSANNASADAEQEVVDSHGYYAKELSNIKQRLRDLEP